MHYHMEVILPNTTDVKGSLNKFLEQFSENNEDSRTGFWDWWQIGGRYSASKAEALCDPQKLAEFYEELKKQKVTVSGLTWGKQELSPPSQEAFVDGLWLKYFPDSPMKHAPMFKHSGQEIGVMDICKVLEVPPLLNAYSVLICNDEDAATLLHKEMWNGCTHQKTEFNGNVSEAIAKHNESLKNYSDEYRERSIVRPDWLCVTVDYHS